MLVRTFLAVSLSGLIYSSAFAEGTTTPLDQLPESNVIPIENVALSKPTAQDELQNLVDQVTTDVATETTQQAIAETESALPELNTETVNTETENVETQTTPTTVSTTPPAGVLKYQFPSLMARNLYP